MVFQSLMNHLSGALALENKNNIKNYNLEPLLNIKIRQFKEQANIIKRHQADEI